MILEKNNIRDLIWVNGAWDKETKSFMYSQEINLAGGMQAEFFISLVENPVRIC